MFDFYLVYQNYTTAELLRIVERPSLYQPDAVAAAMRLLAERKPGEQEIQDARAEFAHEIESTAAPLWMDRQLERIAAVFRYLFLPSAKFDPQKWVYWICIALLVRVILRASHFPPFISVLFHCDTCSAGELFMLVIDWVWEPALIVLLLLRRKVGWMLAVFYAGMRISEFLVTLVVYWRIGASVFRLTQLFWMLMYAAMLWLLSRWEMIRLFQASRRLYRQMLIAAAVVGGLMIAAIVMHA